MGMLVLRSFHIRYKGRILGHWDGRRDWRYLRSFGKGINDGMIFVCAFIG